ncbi:MAG: ABC transporter substrate-binding protein [Nitrospirae bacterium]|nr:ABC transporter substrate-binding protein [Nitrospirota bacterium]
MFNSYLNKSILIVTTLLLFSVYRETCAYAASGSRVAVLLSQASAPYQDALEGFRRYLDEKGSGASFDIYHLSGNKTTDEQIVRKIIGERAALIYCLGTPAAEAALEQITDIPVIAGLVLKTDKFHNRKNVAGVSLEIPLTTQFEMMRRILPEARTIGVLYNPDQNKQLVASAAEISGKFNLSLKAYQVYSPKDLPDALKHMSGTVDALWGINDNVVYTPETAKQILLFSFRNYIPFIGLSSEWVKAGALYAPGRDYRSIGAQCGEMGLKVLRGAHADSIPDASPRRVVYSLNLKTAAHMKISFPETIIREANKIY